MFYYNKTFYLWQTHAIRKYNKYCRKVLTDDIKVAGKTLDGNNSLAALARW